MKFSGNPSMSDQSGAGEETSETVGAVLRGLISRPKERLIRRWNWKAALLSSLVRAMIFFLANLTAGRQAALAAMLREFCFRSVASGFYGGITESFRFVQPRWAATGAVLVLLPILNHSAEFLLHYLLGTPHLKTSMAASVGFTILSTGFNLFAMRRGVLITGNLRQSLGQDLKMVPGLLLSYCLALVRIPRDVIRLLWSSCQKLGPSWNSSRQREKQDQTSSSFTLPGKERKTLPA